jgi:hypothetical protein
MTSWWYDGAEPKVGGGKLARGILQQDFSS